MDYLEHDSREGSRPVMWPVTRRFAILATLFACPWCFAAQDPDAAQPASGRTVEEWTPTSSVHFEASVGVPQPLTLGLSVPLGDYSRAYIQSGVFRYPIVGGAQAFGISSIELGWRSGVSPRFEVSLFSGYRSVFAAMTSVSLPTTVWFQTWYAGVFAGWNYRVGRWLEGTFGLGVEFAVAGGAAMSFTDSSGTTWESSPTLTRVARWPLPRVTLFRLSLR